MPINQPAQPQKTPQAGQPNAGDRGSSQPVDDQGNVESRQEKEARLAAEKKPADPAKKSA